MRAIVTIVLLFVMAGMTGTSPQPALMDDETGPRSGKLLFHLKSLLQDF